ncbi:hypothetical protein AB1Y20_004865 [Prymnesium parvum]|uniref:HAT C-terminal dimerisation domain-containing protein n=1 Tax=Prymnesium parvum TaxID=97485 RepID=A0AB34IXW0_PRYPA
MAEVLRWKRITRDRWERYVDEDGALINEFWMMWEIRTEFPLHFITFKQCAAHLHHEANVEQVFSLAGRLSDPSLDPAHMELLVRIHFNKKAYMPSLKDIRERYFLK